MAIMISPSKIKQETTRMLKVWKANREFRLHDATFADYKALHDQMDQFIQETAAKDRELTEIMKRRNAVLLKLQAINGRVRGGFRNFYGRDSIQFQQASGTPVARKPRKKA